MTLKELAADAQKLAEALAENEPAPCDRLKAGERSCLHQEYERPLTRAEKDKGWAARPFYAYDGNKLCNSCCAFWHASRAHQILHEMACWRVRIEAQEARKAGDGTPV